jgi:ElaB/YqjD/DUF883 family membrane-anchored ribosome-binding protein
MATDVAGRMLSATSRTNQPQALLSLAQLYDTLQDSIWIELDKSSEVGSMRRNLQREHLKRMLAVLLRPVPGTLADVRSLQRQNAVRLRAKITTALASSKAQMSRITRAHLEESIAAIDDALKATSVKVAG